MLNIDYYDLILTLDVSERADKIMLDDVGARRTILTLADALTVIIKLLIRKV